MSIRRILVPTDFSAPSREATEYALQLAKDLGATVLLFHSIQMPVFHVAALGGYVAPPSVFEENAQLGLQLWIDDADYPDLQIERHYEFGHPVTQITRFAEEHEIDLIVMGTHGRGMAAHMLLGSVAERVVRSAQCPVLTLHPGRELAATFDPMAEAVEG